MTKRRVEKCLLSLEVPCLNLEVPTPMRMLCPKDIQGILPKEDIDLNQLQKNKAGKKPGGKGKQTPPITDPKQCTEGKKCVTNAGGKDPQGGSSGRWWNACQAYPLCVHPNYFGCYYTWGPNTFCMYG